MNEAWTVVGTGAALLLAGVTMFHSLSTDIKQLSTRVGGLEARISGLEARMAWIEGAIWGDIPRSRPKQAEPDK